MSAAFRIEVGSDIVPAVATDVPPSPAVETHGLDAWYGEFQALRKVDFSAAKGRITAIIGPSGCGKSTLLRALNRMNDLVPGYRTEGEVLLEGVAAPTDPAGVIALRRRMGMLFQRPNPFPMSVFDNVAYGLRLEKRCSKRELAEPVERALTRAGLWDEVNDRLDKSALGLSGGQQQRLCLARSLAVEPEVILMDEPTSALDPIATLRVEELMREFRDEVTIIIVTHNMQQAARISDVTAFMLMGEGRAGELVEMNTTRELFNRPQDRRTEDYITGRFG
ncbi:MAG: phosphate ABC transporter ATP-binding protein [Candidatus Dormibacteraeota bacterium]|uniref:Phosphate ABC transporter ATP-binding protein n=1 Tax=Candidatus Aeolococcus gillhamiae TaxID=3127015 RepID=A0A934JUF9_9BACT|nr:phosphate ABC transporter ATP-binding protein [Candidatus Dormibacteraeota bacterium]